MDRLANFHIQKYMLSLLSDLAPISAADIVVFAEISLKISSKKVGSHENHELQIVLMVKTDLQIGLEP